MWFHVARWYCDYSFIRAQHLVCDFWLKKAEFPLYHVTHATSPPKQKENSSKRNLD